MASGQEIWLRDRRYLKNFITEFGQYYYKIRYNENNLGMFYNKLSYPMNYIIKEKYVTWFEKVDVIDALGIRISYIRKWINDQWLDIKKQKKMMNNF